MDFRVYVLGFRVSCLKGTSVKDTCPAHDNYINSRLPKFLTPAMFFGFPWSHSSRRFAGKSYVLAVRITDPSILVIDCRKHENY